MPDFGLTEALAAAMKGAKSAEVMRPAEQVLAKRAAATAPEAAAPAVPAAAPAVDPGSPVARVPPKQADPSAPPQPPAPEPPDPAQATPAPPDVATTASDSAPPPPALAAAAEAPEAVPPVPAKGAVAPGNVVTPPPAHIEPLLTPEGQQAQAFVTANLKQFRNLDMTHMPNVDTMSTPDGVKAAILKVAADNQGAIAESRRGVISDQQMIGMAQDLAVNGDVVKQVMERQFGTPLPAEVSLAARMVEQNHMGTLLSLSDRVANGTASSAETLQFVQHAQLVADYRAQLSGVAAEAGRGTRAFGIPVGLPTDVMDHIAGVIRQNNPDLQNMARAIKLAGTPQGIANIVGNTSLMGRIGTAARSLLQRNFINSILSGPATWAHILIGNNVNMLAHQFDLFSAGIMRGTYGLAANLGRFPTAEEGVTMSDAVAHMHGLISGTTDGFRLAGRALRTGTSMDNVLRFDPQEVGGVRNVNPQLGTTQSVLPEIQGTTVGDIARIVDTIVDTPGSRVIAGLDDLTKTMGYRGWLTTMTMKELRARAVDGTLRPGDAEQVARDMVQNPSPEMQQAAEAWGHRMTFQTPFQPGGPGEAFSNLINSKVPALKFIFPFVRTATNIFKQSVGERSLLGLASARIRSQIAQGGFEGDLARARMTTGTGIAGMFAWMAVHDRLTGDPPKDPKERMLWEQDGRTPYSIRVTNPITGKDTWRSINWFEPFSTIAGVTADIMKLKAYIEGQSTADTLMDQDRKLDDAASHVAMSIIQNTGNKTFMQGAAKFSEMYNDPERSFNMWKNDFLASNVPYSGMLKFARNEQDPYMRQAKTLVDTVKNELPTVMGVPGSKTLPPKLDVFGQPRTHYAANALLGPLNPLPGSDEKSDEVTDEIYNLMDKTRVVPITMPGQQITLLGSGRGLQDGQGLHLTPAEYADYVQKARSDKVFDGGTLNFREKIQQTIETPAYQALSPANRNELISKIQRQADKAGREALWTDNDDFRERMMAWAAKMNRLKAGQ